MDTKSIVSLLVLGSEVFHIVLAEVGDKEKQTARFLRGIVFLCFVILLDI